MRLVYDPLASVRPRAAAAASGLIPSHHRAALSATAIELFDAGFSREEVGVLLAGLYGVQQREAAYLDEVWRVLTVHAMLRGGDVRGEGERWGGAGGERRAVSFGEPPRHPAALPTGMWLLRPTGAEDGPLPAVARLGIPEAKRLVHLLARHLMEPWQVEAMFETFSDVEANADGCVNEADLGRVLRMLNPHWRLARAVEPPRGYWEATWHDLEPQVTARIAGVRTHATAALRALPVVGAFVGGDPVKSLWVGPKSKGKAARDNWVDTFRRSGVA